MGYFEGTSTYDDDDGSEYDDDDYDDGDCSDYDDYDDDDGSDYDDDDDRSRYQSKLPLIKMPWVAPTEVPTMIAVGVARPRAHGQDTTTTLLI